VAGWLGNRRSWENANMERFAKSVAFVILALTAMAFVIALVGKNTFMP
jgi:hypothetical protein